MNVRATLLIILVTCFCISEHAWGQQTSRGTFVKLMDAQELWAEDRYDEALVILEELAADNQDRDYDFAIIQQYIAHTAMLGDRPEMVRPALNKALERPGLPEKLVIEIKLFLGQIVLGDEEYELARSLLEEWYAFASRDAELPPPPAQVFSLAYANYMTKNLPRAEVLLADAVARERTVKNTWYRIYYQVLFEQRKYDQAEVVIYGLVTRDPNNEDYWRMLANHYMQLEDSREALSAMAIADLQGLLDGSKDQERLSSLYAFVEVPERAARILETAVASEGVEADAETLRRLGDLWLLARNREKALGYLTQSAAESPDGTTFELVGSLLFEDEKWEEAHEAYVRALDYGGLEKPERVHLLAGMSAMRAGDKAAARESFNEARKSDEYRSQAVSMLRQLDNS